MLNLIINGNALPKSGIKGGPVLCIANPDGSPNRSQCYQPNKQDSLRVTLAASENPNLTFTAQPHAIESVAPNGLLVLSYTLKNDSAVQMNNLTLTPQGADGLLFRNNAITNNCGTTLAANTSCAIQYEFSAPASPQQFTVLLTAAVSGGIQVQASTHIDVKNYAFSWQQTNGPVGGYVASLASPVESPNIIHASGSRGMFKSTDSGDSWTPINYGLVGSGINGIAAPTANTVYAALQGGGVYKSTNGGADWAAASTGLPPGEAILSFFALNASTLYAGTFSSGVYKSTDGGASWSSATTGITTNDIRSLFAIQGVSNTIVYAGTNGGGVFQSADGGSTWTAANTGLPSNASILASLR